MNEDILKGKWKQLKGEVKTQWGELTNDDLERIEGERNKLEGRLQERYGYSRQQAQEEVDKFLSKTEEELGGLQNTVQSAVAEAQAKLQQQVDSARSSVESKAEEYNKRVKDTAPGEVTQAVDEYPWLVVIGAFLVGLLVGMLLSPNSS